MRYFRVLTILGLFLVCASYASAQRVAVSVGLGAPAYLGPAPVCAYGYYPYYPYTCAPYGYYDPSWFVGGVFIGAGPWYHGYYGHPVYNGRPVYGPWPHPYARGPVYVGHGPVPGGFHGAAAFHAAGHR
jgi:hypothetical protein